MLVHTTSSFGLTNVVNQGCMARIKARGSRIHQSCIAIYQQFLELRQAVTFEDFKWALTVRMNDVPLVYLFIVMTTVSNIYLSIITDRNKSQANSDDLLHTITPDDIAITSLVLGLMSVIYGKITHIAELLTHTPRRKAYNRYFETNNHPEAILFLRGQSKREAPAFDLYHPTQLMMASKLSKKYRLIQRNVSGIDSCNQALKEARDSGYRIRGVWLEFHGFKDSVKMGGKTVMGSALRGLRYDLVEFDGHFVLDACDTGAKRVNALNVAEWVKLGAGPMRRVTAPTKSPRHGSIQDYDPKNGSCKIYFKCQEDGTPIGEDLTYSPSYKTAVKKLQKQVLNGAAKRQGADGCFRHLFRRFARFCYTPVLKKI